MSTILSLGRNVFKDCKLAALMNILQFAYWTKLAIASLNHLVIFLGKDDSQCQDAWYARGIEDGITGDVKGTLTVVIQYRRTATCDLEVTNQVA